MLSEDDDVDIHAIKRQGMTISEIARCTAHDRNGSSPTWPGSTLRGYVNEQNPDQFDKFVDYVTARMTEDPHF